MTYRYVGQDFKQPHIQLISSFRQSSFISHRRDESAIFFDINQAAIIIKLVEQIASEELSYIDVATTIKNCCSLYIYNKATQFSTLIKNTTLFHQDKYFQIDYFSLERNYSNFRNIKRQLRQENVSFMVMQIILAHECYHYITFRNLEPSSKEPAKKLFEFALEQVCYENQPNFEDIAKYNGNLPSLSKETLLTIKTDLKNRRSYYECNKTHLIEEIDCDVFALTSILDMKLNDPTKSYSFQEILNFGINYYLVYCILDFHIAMNRRALMSVEGSVKGIKPANIADMNLRKAAIIRCTFNFIFYHFFGDDSSTDKKYDQDYSDYTKKIFDVKLGIDFLYIMPITNLTTEYLEMIEQTLKFKENSL